MFEELNVYLKGKMNIDYWYDEALFICEDILAQFTDGEWQNLVEEIPTENDEWKQRLVECLGEFHNTYELNIILQIINTDNDELFTICVDRLRSMNLSNVGEDKRTQIICKINELILGATLPVKGILEKFLEKAEENGVN